MKKSQKRSANDGNHLIFYTSLIEFSGIPEIGQVRIKFPNFFAGIQEKPL
jgi:hypothetical protein